MPISQLRIACLQVAAPSDDDAAEHRTLTDAIHRAADGGARLVLLPELHQGAYFCQSEQLGPYDTAEPVPGPTTSWLGRLAAELGIVIVGSVFERRAAGLYHNTAVVLDADGRLAGRYRKMHIPDDPGFYEKFYFTPGDAAPAGPGFSTIDTAVGRLGVLVCWDQWFPEAARLMALAGAEVLLYPTAIGWDPADPAEEQARQLDAWITVQRGHAVANGLPVAACNRIGFEPAAPETPDAATASGTGIAFWGNSFICGPQGEFLARAGSGGAEVLTADLNLARSEQVRRIWPFLRDRRVDAYDDLLKRWRD